MHIAWDSLLIVFVVSFAGAVAVTVLVSLALVALSPRPGAVGPTGVAPVAAVSNGSRMAAAVCLSAAAVIVLYGLYIIVR